MVHYSVINVIPIIVLYIVSIIKLSSVWCLFVRNKVYVFLV